MLDREEHAKHTAEAIAELRMLVKELAAEKEMERNEHTAVVSKSELRIEKLEAKLEKAVKGQSILSGRGK